MYKVVDFGRYCWQCKNFSKSEDEEPCYDCMAHPLNEDSHKPIHFDESQGHEKLPFDKIEFLRPYTYEAEYSKLDYGFAKAYYERLDTLPNMGGCSAFRKGELVGRNLDWTYDETPEYIVKTPANNGRHAVLGIASGFKNIDDGSMWDDRYKVLPFQLYDGINDAGLTVSILVVPTDYGSEPSQPLIQQKDSINGLMLSRYMLDNFSSAKEAVEYIRDYVSVYFSTKYIRDFHYVLHYFVADAENTYALEFVDGSTKIINIRSVPYMTNFNLHAVIRNGSGSVLTPATRTREQDPVNSNKITPHGSGLERYNLINSKWPGIASKTDVEKLLKELNYTRAYLSSPNPSNPYWYTEFVYGDLWCNSYPSAYEDAVKTASELYRTRSRLTGLTWHTVHSSIYDINKKELAVSFQEDSTQYIYTL